MDLMSVIETETFSDQVVALYSFEKGNRAEHSEFNKDLGGPLCAIGGSLVHWIG